MKTTKLVNTALLVGLLVTMTLSCHTLAEDQTPAFIEVGKKYQTPIAPMVTATFIVLDLGKDGWIKVRSIDEKTGEPDNPGHVIWLNTKAALFIEEFSDNKKK